MFRINSILNDKENSILAQFFNVLKMDQSLLHNQTDVFTKFKELVQAEFRAQKD